MKAPPAYAALSASASRKDNVLTVTVANTSATEGTEAVISLSGTKPAAAHGRMLAGEMHAKNDFDASPVAIQPLADIAIQGTRYVYPCPPARWPRSPSPCKVHLAIVHSARVETLLQKQGVSAAPLCCIPFVGEETVAFCRKNESFHTDADVL